MANPQPENGYTKIANEIIEQLARIRISGEEMQMLWVVFRKTYGWKKKRAAISLTYFAQATGIKRSSVARALKKLVSKKILHSYNKETRTSTEYALNKDYEQWEHSLKKVTTPKPGYNKETRGSYNKETTGVVTILRPNKESNKEKNKEKTLCSNSEEFKLACEFFDSIIEWKPDFKPPTNAAFTKWVKSFDLMMRIDKRSLTRTRELIDYIAHDNFIPREGTTWDGWQGKILSPDKLRKQWDKVDNSEKRSKSSKKSSLVIDEDRDYRSGYNMKFIN